MLILNNINLTLGRSTPLERQLFYDLNLEVQKGEFLIVTGENGTGKSTLFKLIAGSIQPDNGKIFIDQVDVTNQSQVKRSKDIAHVMQDPRIGTMENMTIFENMAFACMRGKARSLLPAFNIRRKEFFQEKLKVLGIGLENRLNELVINLSGGQRQALSLVMATLNKSKILLLDEITSALDPKFSSQVMEIANNLIRKENLTTIMITHNTQHAKSFGDRTLMLPNLL